MPPWVQSAKNVTPSADLDGGPHLPPPFALRRAVAKFNLSPNDLYVAMAHCSLRKGASDEAVRKEADAVATWVSHYVDDPPTDFSILPEIRFHIDFVKSGKIGLLAAGMSHLYMDARGYRFWMHWVDAPYWPKPRRNTKRTPDYIFIGSSQHDWVLMESKGTWSGSKNAVKREAIKGYEGQIDPYVETSVAAATVSHGFALGVHVTPHNAASIWVIRSPLRAAVFRDPGPDPSVSRGEPPPPQYLSATDLIRSCFRPTLGLMRLESAVAAIDAGEPLRVPPQVFELPIGTGFVLFSQSDAPPINPLLSIGTARFATAASPFEGVFGIEARIGRAVLQALSRGSGQHLETPLYPLTPEQLAGLKASPEITVFPNGLVWIPINLFDQYLEIALRSGRGGYQAQVNVEQNWIQVPISMSL